MFAVVSLSGTLTKSSYAAELHQDSLSREATAPTLFAGPNVCWKPINMRQKCDGCSQCGALTVRHGACKRNDFLSMCRSITANVLIISLLATTQKVGAKHCKDRLCSERATSRTRHIQMFGDRFLKTNTAIAKSRWRRLGT